MFSSPFTTLKSQRYIYSHPLRSPVWCTARETIMKASCTASGSKWTRNWSKDCCTWRKTSCHEVQTKMWGKGGGAFFDAAIMSKILWFQSGPKKITPLVYEVRNCVAVQWCIILYGICLIICSDMCVLCHVWPSCYSKVHALLREK